MLANADRQLIVLIPCRDEDAAAKRSRIAQQREEALKRADAHAAEELIRAREHEREQAARQRCAICCWQRS